MNLHVNLKWSTILARLNKAAKKELFRLDQYGAIRKLVINGDREDYIYETSTISDKAEFIYKHSAIMCKF